jgi:glutamate racemase
MIGIIDSGVSGLGLLKLLRAALPRHDMTYMGDTLYAPYGSKSVDAIIRRVSENTAFLSREGATLIILAGFTAAAVAADAVADRLKVPVIDVVASAAAQAVVLSKRQSIGVIGSRAAMNSGACERKIRALKPTAAVFSVPVPLIGPLVENEWHGRPEFNRIVKKYLHPLKVRQVDVLVLGCPYAGMIKRVLQRKIGTRTVLVDPAETAVLEVKRFLTRYSGADSGVHKKGEVTCYATDVTPHMDRLAGDILKQRVHFKRIRV